MADQIIEDSDDWNYVSVETEALETEKSGTDGETDYKRKRFMKTYYTKNLKVAKKSYFQKIPFLRSLKVDLGLEKVVMFLCNVQNSSI
jgi:hypothetical protein